MPWVLTRRRRQLCRRVMELAETRSSGSMRRASWDWASAAWTPRQTAWRWCTARLEPSMGPGNTVWTHGTFTTRITSSACRTVSATTGCALRAATTATWNSSGHSMRFRTPPSSGRPSVLLLAPKQPFPFPPPQARLLNSFVLGFPLCLDIEGFKFPCEALCVLPWLRWATDCDLLCLGVIGCLRCDDSDCRAGDLAKPSFLFFFGAGITMYCHCFLTCLLPPSLF